MSENDTVHLLKECDAGTKMAVSTINGVPEKVSDEGLKQLLTESRSCHEDLGGEIHGLLNEHEASEKDPAVIAKGMSWVKTNVKTAMDESDAAIAGLVTDGCNMGVKSLHKYLNQYSDADDTSKNICRRLSSLEEELCEGLRCYL
ncbi:MAG: hypothetical protein LUH00_06535 [Lachnospiraceae bacterium]|nr:hypothetical protein [Lachnospiraceae bacterium]